LRCVLLAGFCGIASAEIALMRIHRNTFRVLSASCLLVAAGCSHLEPPTIFNPGDLQYQRARANRFDPFPDPDAGPDIPEARPREFSNPPPEASRARWHKTPPLP
jgi:hypothetical protein